MVFRCNVIGKFLNRRVQELYRQHDEQYANHGDVPGRIWRNEEAGRYGYRENNGLLAHRCLGRHTIDDSAPRILGGTKDSLHGALPFDQAPARSQRELRYWRMLTIVHPGIRSVAQPG
jgi:hypothetical protein